MGTKFRGWTKMDSCGFHDICNIIKVNKYFVGILNLWIALPMKNMKLSVQRIKWLYCMLLFICRMMSHTSAFPSILKCSTTMTTTMRKKRVSACLYSCCTSGAILIKHLRENLKLRLKELEHKKLGWKVFILKYDLCKSLSKELWCKMADT